MANVSKLQAVSAGLCPRCRQGKIFKTALYNPIGFGEMNELCPHCGLRFEIEPGYFIGAMYVSYAFSGGLSLVLGFTLFYVFNNPPGWVYALVVSIGVIVISTINFRLSRVIWLYYVAGISYDPAL